MDSYALAILLEVRTMKRTADALKTINNIDDKLLVAMSENPPPMLEKSTDNDNENN